MAITASTVKELREKTGAGMMDCKKALTECEGNFDKAVDWLRTKGLSKAAKKSDRVAAEGLVTSYIHGNGRIGVLLEVNSETDFVARNEQFQAFTKDVAMHIAAVNPACVNPEELDQSLVEKEKEVLEVTRDSHEKQIDKIEEIHEQEIKKRDKIIAEYNKIVAGIEDKYAEESKKLSKKKKEEIFKNEKEKNQKEK